MTGNLYTLIQKYAEGKMTGQELGDMRDQLNSADDNSLRHALSRMWDKEPISRPLNDKKQKESFNKIIEKISTNEKVNSGNNRRRHRVWWAAAAAIVIGIIIGGTVLWHRQYTNKAPYEQKLSAEVKDAIKRSIDTNHCSIEMKSLNRQNHSAIAKQLSKYCHDKEVVENLSEAMQISTHIDKEGWISLDDGTLVHLNGDSRLFYPTHFNRDSRNVILDGEAYFMVATDHSRPFTVHTAYGDIKEYGTEFNVSARKGRDVAEVVLVNGSIGVIPTSGQERMMQPGMLCRMSASACILTTTDTEPYRAWNTGKIEFQGWPLERLMRIIARWYNCKVEYADDSLKNERLSGSFDRYDSSSTTLQALKTVTGLRFELSDNKVVIAPR